MIKLDATRILIPVDFSTTSKKAVKHAASLAQHNKGELFLLYVRRKKSLISMPYSTAELRSIAEQSNNYKKLMEDTAEEIRSTYTIPVKILVGIGGRISEIIKIAEKKKIGLIVMGTQGSDSNSSLFSGSNSHRVVSRSQIPVMTVRTDIKKSAYANILLPIDLSDHSRQKVVLAIQIAKIHNAKIHLLGLIGAGQTDYLGKLQTIVKQVEKRIIEDEIQVSSEIIKTDIPVQRTLSAAKRFKADVIITMTDQKIGSSGFLSSSFDHELVDKSEIPVLSVPPEVHEENIAPASIGGLW